MATKPTKVEGLSVNADTMNGIINKSPVLQSSVPYADGSSENLRAIGEAIMDYEPAANEFLGIINRIASTIISSKLYYNHFALVKRGMLDFGETIREIFIQMAEPYMYDLDKAQTDLYKIEQPNILEAFYSINYKEVYKATVVEIEMQSAFLSYEAMTDFMQKIIEQMYTAAAYDEEQVTLYTIAHGMLNGYIKPISTKEVTTDNLKDIVSQVKATSNKMTFKKTIYNKAGVPTESKPSEQFILVNSDFDAAMDVNVLASAFNMNYTNFLQQRILVDTFAALDNTRLTKIFKDYPEGTYTALTDAQIEKLEKVPLAIVDRKAFMIYDNRDKTRNAYNGLGDYWNYFYHTWKTFALSPFANAVYFEPEESTPVTPVTPPSET